MAYRDPSTFGFSVTPWVKRLLLANSAVFLLTYALPQIQYYLAFEPRSVLTHPWTIITYMFVHGNIWHILFNMLGLFFFGPPLEERWGSGEFIKYYVICGLGAAALSFLFAFNSSVIGASGAVYGIMLAYALNWPDAPIYIYGILPVKAKWLVLIYVAISLLSAFGGAGGGIAHFAHLGGFAAGFLYLKLDDPINERVHRLKRMMTRPRLTVVPGEQRTTAPQPRRIEPRQTRRKEELLLDDVDRVLDKISASGMSSLTADERKLLDEVSKRFRSH